MTEILADRDKDAHDDESRTDTGGNDVNEAHDADLDGDTEATTDSQTRPAASDKISGINEVAHASKDVERVAGPAYDKTGRPHSPDPNLVDWDGPDDPANPRNWSKTYKVINVVLISASVLYCNIATTMFAPGANVMEREFGYDNQAIEILTITIASLGFAIGPLFLAPLCEVIGRVPIYRGAAICYLGFTVGCARSTGVGEFLAFRLLAGLSASPFMTTGGGTIADLLEKEERGGAMAIFSVGPLLGPVCGRSNDAGCPMC